MAGLQEQRQRKEYCAILGVDEAASKEEIKKAYKQLALRCHPDKNQLNPEATKEFQRISEAYTGLCQGDGYDDDVDIDGGGGFSVFELLQMFFMRSQLFIRPTWLRRFREANDVVVDSEIPCNSGQRNHWNCSTQPTWNEDWQVPGNVRLSSSSDGRGNSGKSKKKNNNNRKNASSRKSTKEASTCNDSASSSTGASANDCPGADQRTGASTDEGNSATKEASNGGLTSDPVIEKQSDIDQVVSDESKEQTGVADNNSSARCSKTEDVVNNGANAERRGSNASVNGASQNSQPSDRKPNRKKLQAEQRKKKKVPTATLR